MKRNLARSSDFPPSLVTTNRCDLRFLALHSIIHPLAITEFIYRYSSPLSANIFLSFYLSTPPPTAASTGTSTPLPTPSQVRQSQLSRILANLTKAGMKSKDLSTNDLAKDHARYLVGGKMLVEGERVFRFEFPERPNALRKFLESLGGRFNITLFHYRNTGGG